MVARISGWTIRLVLALMLPIAACGNDEPDQPAVLTSPSPQAAPASPSPSPSPEGETYVVESGDTLSAIAQRFDTTVEAIVDANDLDNPDFLSIGDELLIPPEPPAPPSEAPSG
jgi:LysM repeat protein